MPRAKLLAALAIVFLLGALTPYLARTAEDKPREIPALKVAYIDVGRLFTECSSYKEAIEQMKQQTQELEEKFKGECMDMKNLSEVMKGYPPESEDYKQTGIELAMKEQGFKLRQSEARKNFETRINKIQFQLYQRINRFCRQKCEQYGIGVLLRHNTSPVDVNDPQQVLRGINASIVYGDARLDLTDEILAELNTLRTYALA